MKRIVFWALPLLLIGALTTQGFAQDVKWKGTEYEDYMGVYNEKDNAKKAAGAEKYFVDHKDADPIALTQIYSMMLLSYANAGNWAKTLETVERANSGPQPYPCGKTKVHPDWVARRDQSQEQCKDH